MSSTVLFIYLSLCGLVAMVGSDRKTGYWGALLISLIIGPLFGLIVILLFEKKRKYEIGNLVTIAEQFDYSIHEEYEQLKSFMQENIISKKEYSLALVNLESKINETFQDKLGVNFNNIEKSVLNKFVNDRLNSEELIIYNTSVIGK